MLQDYIATYLKKAKYERIEQGKRFYAAIKELRGVWATGKTREECRKNLTSTLEGWIIFRLRRNLSIVDTLNEWRTRMQNTLRLCAGSFGATRRVNALRCRC